MGRVNLSNYPRGTKTRPEGGNYIFPRPGNSPGLTSDHMVRKIRDNFLDSSGDVGDFVRISKNIIRPEHLPPRVIPRTTGDDKETRHKVPVR